MSDEEGVGVVGIIAGTSAPRHNVVTPVLVFENRIGGVATLAGFGDAVVIDATVVVIAGVKLPGQAELLGVAHAENALSFSFCLGESGQEHAGENRDDGDDDEQLNEREACAPRLRLDTHKKVQSGLAGNLPNRWKKANGRFGAQGGERRAGMTDDPRGE